MSVVYPALVVCMCDLSITHGWGVVLVVLCCVYSCLRAADLFYDKYACVLCSLLVYTLIPCASVVWYLFGYIALNSLGGLLGTQGGIIFILSY